MRLFRKVVDERQEYEMMRVERSSFWILFFGLVAAVLIQVALYGFDFALVAGEVIILLLCSVWSLVGYVRRGLWDYYSKPGIKAYIFYSVAAAVITGTAATLPIYFRYGLPLWECLMIFAISAVSAFILAFIVLFAIGSITKKRQQKLQNDYTDEK